MTQCADLQADASIRQAAITAGDDRIIGLVFCDLVADEVWCHGQCYRNYFRPDKALTWMISLTWLKPITIILMTNCLSLFD